MRSDSISGYALLSDCHSAALVSRAGSVDWLCFPRFDSPSVFARILDPRAGHWSIRPVESAEISRRYVDQTLVLETSFRTSKGKAILRDAMATGINDRGHELGAGAPHALLRQVTCTEGSVELVLEYSPRPEYGIIEPLFLSREGGVFARGGATRLLLSSSMPLRVEGNTVRGRFRLQAGELAAFSALFASSSETEPKFFDQTEIIRRMESTIEAWKSWSVVHQNYDGPWREQVMNSGRVLQGLTYYPTGAIVAAPTTSLPESIGGPRNWDYRYTWVRDASLTLEALWVAACPDEARKFFDFLTGSAATQVSRGMDLQIMFGIGGEHDLTERELPHLSGWRESRPVRIGNGAWSQRQLDVYGELMGALFRLKERLMGMSDPVLRFLREVTHTAAASWEKKDQGIWEIRGAPGDFLYSKLMCWVAVDRAIQMAPLLKGEKDVPRWQDAREKIRHAILRKGWNERVGAFTQKFGTRDLDASNLMIPIVGFLPGDDPRVLSTVEAIERDLRDKRGLVYRYRSEDGMEGEEGSFLLCTFWLAQAQALAGNVEAARETFEIAAGFANDVGLLSEEVEPRQGELIGNFPQAFSHIGLINAAWAISEAEGREGLRQASEQDH